MRAIKQGNLSIEQQNKVKNMLSMFEDFYEKKAKVEFKGSNYRVEQKRIEDIKQLSNIKLRELFLKLCDKKYSIKKRLSLLQEYDVSIKQFLKIRRELNLKLIFSSDLRKAIADELTPLYESGTRLSDLVKEYSLTHETIRYIMKSHKQK